MSDKVIIKEVVNTEGEAISDDQEYPSEFVIKCEEILKELTVTYKKQKDQIKDLIKLHKKELKKNQKAKNNYKARAKTGFTKESEVPDKLCEFLSLTKGTRLPRTKVTSLFIKECDKRGLLYSKDKRIIIPNGDIKKLFPKLADVKEISTDPKDPNGLNFYNLQHHLTDCYNSIKKISLK